MRTFSLSTILLAFVCFTSFAQNDQTILTKINGNIEISIDGQLNEEEWNRSNKSQIKVNNDWTVSVHYFQDDSHLYFAFENVKLKEGTELYPEVLIDANHNKGTSWDTNDWWFHTSYSNCENKGRFNDYSTCKDGWNGNNFPLKQGQFVEMKISKALIGVTDGDVIGIAFDVTDTSEKWYFSPADATLESTRNWMSFRL